MISSLQVRVPSAPVALLSPDKNALQLLLRSLQGFLQEVERGKTTSSNALTVVQPPVTISSEPRKIERPRRAVD